MGGENGEEEQAFYEKDGGGKHMGRWVGDVKKAHPSVSGAGREDKGVRWAQKNGPAEV